MGQTAETREVSTLRPLPPPTIDPSAPVAMRPGRESPRTPWGDALISLAFWLLLVLVGISFAILVLAPKLLRREELTRKFHQGQWELVTLQEQTKALRQVAHALEHDDRFQAELARSQLGAVGHREERFPVPEDLSLSNPLEPPVPQLPIVPVQSWGLFWLERFATDAALRTGLVLFCVTGCLLGFGWLHEGAWHSSRPRPVRAISQWLARRYARG
ncbi:MAG: hypothetical protein C0478_02510 [Planctomyces sp.]|nr:hypothetical protein [Planctomyces sp.]